MNIYELNDEGVNQTFQGKQKMETIKWIWNNLSQIKDILWIIFTLIATVIAVLTYKRARFTLLQPLRAEVIRKQTELLMDVITFFADKTQFWVNLDLSSLVNLNAYQSLKAYGYILDEEEQFKDAYREMSFCAMIVSRKARLDCIELPDTFGEITKKESMKENNRKKYELLEKGDIDIEMIHLTKSYYDTMKRLEDFCNNPFMPTQIKEILTEIISNITSDVSVILKEVLEEFILSVYERKKSGNVEIEFNGLYNEFNRKSKNNDILIERIMSEIRKYLMVDRKW